MAGVYFEFTAQGAYVKVAAIDSESGLEVSIVGAAGTPQAELERIAKRKLEFVRKKMAQPEKAKRGPGELA
jgi:Domain of unknown function (DUF6898)